MNSPTDLSGRSPPWLLGLDINSMRRRCGDLAHFARVVLVSIEDGPQRGARQLHISNACGLTLEVEVDRACDIGRVQYKGIPIGWTSPSGLQHPAPLHESEDGLGLLRSFSGLLVTCGLDHVGAPAIGDASAFGYSLRKRLSYPLHGRIGSAAARLLGWGVEWNRERPVLWCEALVRQAAVFGEALELRRRIEVDVYEPTIAVKDVVSNVCFRPCGHQILYHVNLGYPLLSGNAQLLLETLEGREQLEYGDPRDECSETVENISLRGDANGWAHAQLSSPDAALTFHLAFDKTTLPSFARWCAAEPGTYVTGLEPQSSPSRSTGKDPTGVLMPGDSVDYQLIMKLRSAEDSYDGYRGSG